MNNRKLIIYGLVANVVLFAGGAALVSAFSDDAPTVKLTPAPSAVRPGPANQSLRYMPPMVPGVPGVPAVAPTEPRSGTLPPVYSVARRDSLRSTRRDLQEGLGALGERVRECGAQGASFVLALLATEGEIRVEEARVDSRGQATEKAVDCARSALSGQVIQVAAVEAGRRWELPLSVSSQ